MVPQAQYQAEAAKKIMLSGLHASDSSESKADLLAILVKMYYVLGRSNTINNKYPFLYFCLFSYAKNSQWPAVSTEAKSFFEKDSARVIYTIGPFGRYAVCKS